MGDDRLKTPESALPVPAEGFAYVSNVAGQPTDKDGNGFISKVSLADGKIIAPEWAKGLDAPKGLALSGGKLYASDIDKLVEIDPKTGKIVAKYDAPGPHSSTTSPPTRRATSTSPNSSTSTIWRLADGKFEKWIEGPALKFPNGLHVAGDKLIIAAWGAPGTSATRLRRRPTCSRFRSRIKRSATLATARRSATWTASSRSATLSRHRLGGGRSLPHRPQGQGDADCSTSIRAAPTSAMCRRRDCC